MRYLFTVLLMSLCILSIAETQEPKEESTFGPVQAGRVIGLEVPALFELESATNIKVMTKSATDNDTPLTMEQGDTIRLHLLLVDSGKRPTFSQDLSAKLQSPLTFAAGKVATLGEFDFSKLTLAPARGMKNGFPVLDTKKTFPSASLQPGRYGMRVVLIHSVKGQATPLTIASAMVPVEIKPMSGDRMSEEERQKRLKAYMSRLKEGAYGGQEVSEKLTALGTCAVAPLIEAAEQVKGKDAGSVRAWAIASMAGIQDPKVSEFFRKIVVKPTKPGDLPYIAWHSQRLHDQQVDQLVMDCTKAILRKEKTPWEKNGVKVPRGAAQGFLKFAIRSLPRRTFRVDSELVVLCAKHGDPEITHHALSKWRPTKEERSAFKELSKLQLDPRVRDVAVEKYQQWLRQNKRPQLKLKGLTPEQAWQRVSADLNK